MNQFVKQLNLQFMLLSSIPFVDAMVISLPFVNAAVISVSFVNFGAPQDISHSISNIVPHTLSHIRDNLVYIHQQRK